VRIEGGCHCGNLGFVLETRLAPHEITLRACQCGFCRAHGARCASDPDGAASIRVLDPAALSRYRFGERSADFLVCARCGVYVGAVIEHAGERRATLNVGLVPDLATAGPAVPVRYDDEGREARIERRLRVWTPVREMPDG